MVELTPAARRDLAVRRDATGALRVNRPGLQAVIDGLGIEMARSVIANSLEEAEEALKEIGLPCVIRPAYTMGGTGGGFAGNMEEFRALAERGPTSSTARRSPPTSGGAPSPARR